tara:strand:- start:152 stop:586 length:435 start_codon:yes stop_codon:yes gene_type:complete
MGKNPLKALGDPDLTEAERRKAAQDKAMGDVYLKNKGIKGAIEKFKTRNDLVNYTYRTDEGGTIGHTTTKKKIRKEQRKTPKPNEEKPKSSDSDESSKTKKVKTVKYKAPKANKVKGLYLDGKGNNLSTRKHNKRTKTTYWKNR